MAAALLEINEPKEDSIFEDLLLLKDETERVRLWSENVSNGKKKDESIKDELKEEDVVSNAAAAVLECTIKEDPEHDAKSTEATARSEQFESHLEKNYTTNFENDHIEDLKNLFKENNLDVERQKFYQQIFNDILERTSQKKLDDLRQQYLEHLHQISDVEIFKCSICEYQTLSKANLKSHLWIIHKSELELKIFKCLSCTYKSKSLNLLKNHLTHHKEEDSSSNYDNDNNDRSSSPEDFKKEVKKRKVSKRSSITNQCDLCNFKSDNKKLLKKHKETHFIITDNIKKFKCYKCDYDSRDKIIIQKHLLKQHDIKTLNIEKRILKCNICNYTTLCNLSYKCHTLSHKNPDEIEWYNCTLCDFKTKHKKNLPLHLKCHNPEARQLEKKNMCEVCSKTFYRRSHLQRHLLSHKTIDEVTEIFECDQCAFKTKNKACLKQHMDVHSNVKKYVCDICGYQGNRKGNYDLHVLAHKDKTEAEWYSCNVCSYKTKNKYRLNRHLKTGHSSSARDVGYNLDYSCFVCNIELKDRKTYKDHLKTHDNPEEIERKRLACQFCDYRTKHKAFLDLHTLSHKRADEVESFKCDQPGCDFRSKFKMSLKAHMLRHKDPSELTYYKCDVCGHQSRLKWSHKLHLRTHKSMNEVEIFNCDICSYHTKFKAYLKQHLKKRHGIMTMRIRMKN